jgi:hypothetical protein
MKIIRLIPILGALSLLAACGGGGGGGATAPAPASNTVAGVASAGIIRGGTVKVFAPYSSLSGADKKQIGASGLTSLTDGSYSINIGSYSGAVVVEVTGGSYIDEADVSAGLKTIPAGAPLRAAVSSASGIVNVAVTPLTELAVKQAREQDKKLGAASIDTANSQISDLFKVDIINTTPLDASAAISSGTQAQKDYTIVLAGISQLTKTSTQTLDTALANLAGNIDASGKMAAGSSASVTAALTTFLADTGNNKTGVTTVSDNLKNVGTTTIKLTLALTGTGVREVETTLLLPAGVTVSADATGAALNGVLTQSAGGTHTTLAGKFTAAAGSAAGTLHLILLSPDAQIGAGDIITVTCDLAAGASAPTAANFIQKSGGTTLSDQNGTPVTGTLTQHL